jgi:hypothetical protein
MPRKTTQPLFGSTADLLKVRVLVRPPIKARIYQKNNWLEIPVKDRRVISGVNSSTGLSDDQFGKRTQVLCDGCRRLNSTEHGNHKRPGNKIRVRWASTVGSPPARRGHQSRCVCEMFNRRRVACRAPDYESGGQEFESLRARQTSG